MNTLTDHDFIDKCKHLIESRLGWTSSIEWKNRDYEYLAELIYDKTKISISVSTLKRIWQNNRLRIPHVSTLNALAMFLDYENWNDFKTKIKDEIKPSIEIGKSGIQRKKARLIPAVIAFLALIVIGIVFILLKGRKDKVESLNELKNEDIVFTSKKTVTSGLPNTVVFNYDISKIDFDSAFIQQDWDKRRRKRISKENHYHTSIYYYPGYYNARLVINDQEVKKFPIFITTEGWIAIYKKDYFQEIPVYLKNIDLIRNNMLYVSVDDLETNKINNDKDFVIGFFNARDFGKVYCDNFSFETEVKNNPKDGGLTCQYTVITVEAETGQMTASFSDKGCTSNLFMTFGDRAMDGSNTDLSAFGTDLNDWRKIKYRVVNKAVDILVDDKEIYSLTFSRDIGKIISISYHFYGCGAVRMLKLYDKNNKLVYKENFDTTSLDKSF